MATVYHLYIFILDLLYIFIVPFIEKLLDDLFDRTKYGKKTEELAEEIAKDIVQFSTQPKELEEGVKHAVEKIKKFRYEESE